MNRLDGMRSITDRNHRVWDNRSCIEPFAAPPEPCAVLPNLSSTTSTCHDTVLVRISYPVFWRDI